MCGIAGVLVRKGAVIKEGALDRMTSAIAHRGPDGAGLWFSEDRKVGLGHRRLSILDLSDAGAQPMTSASGRYTVSYNGEIYNFVELRKELERSGHQFFSQSDTEVLVAGFDVWGVRETLIRLSGMFVFAAWDRHDCSLILARDRLGIKPLYYSDEQEELIFSSELRPLVVYRGCLPRISVPGLNEFLRLGYVPGPLSIFEGVHKLEPGTYVIYKNGVLSSPTSYWQIEEVASKGLANQFENESLAIEELDSQLRASVNSHMVSDVPLGAFLSGGIDSSTVVALMQTSSSRPVKTFSIGFSEPGYNEALHALAVAQHLGTDHHELYVTERDALAIIPELPDIYDEPFADASQIPTFLISRMAREQVTVALSGDGGDELFAGYNRYLFVSDFWSRLQKMPNSIRSCLSFLLLTIPVRNWDFIFNSFGFALPAKFRPSLPGQKMHKIAAILSASNLRELYGRLVSQCAMPSALLNPLWTHDAPNIGHEHASMDDLSNIECQMVWDAKGYLVDDILTKVDRASMRVGLEVRVPFLDHEVVDFAWRVPLNMKIKNDGGKWLLRQVLYRYVPRELIDRPKMGFSVPMDAWLRGPLEDWARSNLDVSALSRDGILNGSQVNLVLQRHLDKAVDAGGALWTILMFQVWWTRAKTWV